MQRMGLVASLEAELERQLSQRGLPEDWVLPSEQTLAHRHGVSRSTAREALLRLEARGLLVRYPGRKSRALPLDEALTLENLGVALHAAGPAYPARQVLLEGYFTLKRDTTVELLAACCEHASDEDLKKLEVACYALEDAARWEQPQQWVQREFELLLMAAGVAKRVGHLLLVQSLEKAFRGMASRLVPLLDSESLMQWARCAQHVLAERNAQGLRQQLPPLLEARDKRVLGGLVPAHGKADTPQESPRPEGAETSEATARHETVDAPEARPRREMADAPEAPPHPEVEESCRTHESEMAGEPPVGGACACPLWERAGRTQHAPRACVASAGEGPPGEPCPNVSGCQTGLCRALPARAPSPTPPRQAIAEGADDSRAGPLA